jgi:AraC family transcriptional regulator
MFYTKIIEKTIEYIEENIEGEISVQNLADSIGYSRHHFSRFFHALTGYTLIRYIRYRKVDLACKDLVYSDMSILDIAIKYGFNSHEAFTRAFKTITEMTPISYRTRTEYHSILEPIKVENIVLIRGGIELKPIIKDIDYKKFIGLVYHGDNHNQEIGDLWGSFFQRLNEIESQKVDSLYYGLCQPIVDDIELLDFDDLGDITYMAGVEVNENELIPDGMDTWEIKNQKYAIFTHVGKAIDIPQTYKLVYSKWLPESGYEVDAAVDYELYDENYNEGDDDSKMYIYIPIK